METDKLIVHTDIPELSLKKAIRVTPKMKLSEFVTVVQKKCLVDLSNFAIYGKIDEALQQIHDLSASIGTLNLKVELK